MCIKGNGHFLERSSNSLQPIQSTSIHNSHSFQSHNKMHSSAIIFTLFTALVLTVGISVATPIVPQEEVTVGHAVSSPAMHLATGNNGKNAAYCYDSKLATIFNTALANYTHNMQQLAQYVLNQIQLARGGTWLVHAEMIGRQQAHVEWESVSNGDIFAAASTHGCYYHDGVTYIVAVRY